MKRGCTTDGDSNFCWGGKGSRARGKENPPNAGQFKADKEKKSNARRR